MAKDRWEKFEIIGGVLGGVLIPVAIFGAGLFISLADQESAKVQAQAERLTELIEHLSSDNIKEQQIAVEVANYLAEKEELPDVLVPTLTRIATQSENSETAQAATQAVIRVAKQDKAAALAVQEAFSNIAPRVYFHISEETQRVGAREMEIKLENAMEGVGLIVPGIELRSGPKVSELRFFRNSERDEAEAIVDELLKFNVEVKLTDLSKRYKNATNIRPRHYELWLAKDAQ